MNSPPDPEPIARQPSAAVEFLEFWLTGAAAVLRFILPHRPEPLETVELEADVAAPDPDALEAKTAETSPSD